MQAFIKSKQNKHNRNLLKLPVVFAILVFSIRVMCLLGHFLHLHEMVNWNGFSSMAVHSALSMVVMGVELYVLGVDQD